MSTPPLSQLDLVILGQRALTQRVAALEAALRTTHDAPTTALLGSGILSTTTVRPNLCENSSFELYHYGTTIPTSWALTGNGAIVSHQGAVDGATYLRMTGSGSITQVLVGGSPLPAGVLVCSAYVRTSTPSVTVTITITPTTDSSAGDLLLDNGASGWEQITTIPATGQWVRIARSVLLATTQPRTLQIQITSPAGAQVDLDAVKVEYDGGTSHLLPTAYLPTDWGVATTIREFRAENIRAGTLHVGGSSSTAPEIRVLDTNNVELVTIGRRGADTIGVHIKNGAGAVISGGGSLTIRTGGGVTVHDGGSIAVTGTGSIYAGTPTGQRVVLTASGLQSFNAANQEQLRIATADGKLSILGPGSVVVSGGGSIIAGSPTAQRVELSAQGLRSFNAANQEQLSLRTSDGTLTILGPGSVTVSGSGSIVAGSPTGQRTELSAQGLRSFNAANEEQIRLSSSDGKLSILGPGSVVVSGGGSLIAGVANANRMEIRQTGIVVYDTSNRQTVSISTTDATVRVAADAFIVSGTVGFDSLHVTGEIVAGQQLRVGANTLLVQSAGRVGINRVPDPQFDLDIQGSARVGGYLVGKHALQVKNATAIVHFDGDLTPGNTLGSADTHLGVSPIYHVARYDQGKFNKAACIAEATTNYVPNPSFEEGTTGWIDYGGEGASVVRVPGGVFGTYAGEFRYTGGYTYKFIFCPIGAPVGGKTFTLSFYARVTEGTASISNIEIGISFTTYFIMPSFTVTTEWKRFSYTCTFPPSSTETTIKTVLRAIPETGRHIQYDAIQLEEKPYATPYCDGSLGPGHSWVGTPHASHSTRQEGNIQWPATGIISLREGTIALWFKNLYPIPYTEGRGYTRIFEYGVFTESLTRQFLSIYYNPTRTTLIASLCLGAGTWITCETSAPSGADWNHYAITWAPQQPLRFYINGVLASSSTNIHIVSENPLLTEPIVQLTSNGNANGWFDDLVILSRAAPASEIRAIYESDAPVFAETATFGFRSANTLAWADSEGLWAISTTGAAAFGVSGVNNKSWGNLGHPIDAGDVVIGNGINAIWWDASSATLRLRGDGAGVTNINGGNIQTGTITGAQIQAATITGSHIQANTITGSHIQANTITGSHIQANTITGAHIRADAIDGKVITGATIRTGTSGSRIEMTPSGIYTYSPDGLLQIALTTDFGGVLTNSTQSLGIDRYGLWAARRQHPSDPPAIRWYYTVASLAGTWGPPAANELAASQQCYTHGGTQVFYLQQHVPDDQSTIHTATFQLRNALRALGEATLTCTTTTSTPSTATLSASTVALEAKPSGTLGSVMEAKLSARSRTDKQATITVSASSSQSTITSTADQITHTATTTTTITTGSLVLDATIYTFSTDPAFPVLTKDTTAKRLWVNGSFGVSKTLAVARGTASTMTLDNTQGSDSPVTIPNNGTYQLTGGDTFGGMFVIQEVSDTGAAVLGICGGGQVSLVQTNHDLFTTVAGLPGKLSITWSATQGYVIHNLTGSTKTLSIMLFRTRTQS